jgi:hypothetical protein
VSSFTALVKIASWPIVPHIRREEELMYRWAFDNCWRFLAALFISEYGVLRGEWLMILTLTGLNILDWSSGFEMNGSCYTIKHNLAPPPQKKKKKIIVLRVTIETVYHLQKLDLNFCWWISVMPDDMLISCKRFWQFDQTSWYWACSISLVYMI